MQDRELTLHASIEDRHWWFRARRHVMSSILESYGPAKWDHLLEIGCGTGGNLRYFAAHFGSVTGVDLAEVAIAHARERVPGQVFCGDFRTTLNGRWDTYDAVLLADVLEHVDDDRGFLEDVVTRLRPGAVLLITVPANQWLFGPHDVALGHRRRYSRETLGRLWRGLAVEERFVSPFNTLLLPAIAAARLTHRSAEGQSDLQDTSSFTNRLLYSVFNLERHLIGHIPLPWGVSLAAVLRKAVPG